MKQIFPILLLGLVSLPLSAASTLEQRLEKVERQMSRLTVLMMEMQDLRADLQENFGAVEEMVHQMKQLQKQQKSHYLDLDQRLKKLESRAVKPSTKRVAVAETGQEEPEVKAFNQAFALVRSNQNKKALASFQKFVKKFPKGNYTGDAWYWMGRLHTVNGNQKRASRAFAQARTILSDLVKSRPGSVHAERASRKLKKINKK